jgi:hypothetical protein
LDKVEVLSARSTYEGMFPDSPLKWKFYAFQQKLANVFSEAKTDKNIVSFGDSHVEIQAVLAVTRALPHTTTKSVKFAERPSLEQLRRQIELVTNCFQYIHNHEGDLDLQLTVTVNPPSTGSGGTMTASVGRHVAPEDVSETTSLSSLNIPQRQVTGGQSCAQDMDTHDHQSASEEVQVA